MTDGQSELTGTNSQISNITKKERTMRDYDSEIKTLDEKTKEAEKRYRKLLEEKKVLERDKRDNEMEHLKPLAIRAHDLLCSWNHTDGCSWLHEIDVEGVHHWDGGMYSSHARWLEAVEKWMKHERYGMKLTVDKLSAILDVIERGKEEHPDFLCIVRNVIKPA